MLDMKVEIRQGRFLNISFYEHPHSDAVVFLIHGLGASGVQWRNQLDMLKEKYSLVIPDLFGLGESAKPYPIFSNPYSFTELDQDMRAIFVHYAKKNNIVMGHSYGGALAVSLAVSFPKKISKLILIDPIRAEPKAQMSAVFNYPAFVLRLIRSRLEKSFNEAGYDKSTSPELIEKETIASRNNRMYVIKAMVKGMKTIPTMDITELQIPVLIMMGETDNIILPVNIMDFYQPIPHHEFYIMPHAGHMVMLEQPQKTNELILAFLAKR